METPVNIPNHTQPREILLDLLRQAAAAHGIHEQEDLGGVYDEAWPEWYATHMARALAERGYRLVPADGTREGADDELV
ncbi:hypothetical protein [Promicromonospora sp. NPDC050249]|uniref:hypothetical protein n=1 Tax=Promicromonospora sp. NPDC050249 TaxID=3154743 RepID=UPI0033F3494A